MSGINNISAQTALRNLGTANAQADKTQKQPADATSGGDFASQLRDATATQPPVQTADAGLNAMINTNLETEAAKLQALQVQQQLGSQSQAIVNQRASTILSLFNK